MEPGAECPANCEPVGKVIKHVELADKCAAEGVVILVTTSNAYTQGIGQVGFCADIYPEILLAKITGRCGACAAITACCRVESNRRRNRITCISVWTG